MKLSYISKLAMLMFALLVLGYNYSLIGEHSTIPDFQKYDNTAEQKAAFIAYLSPLVARNNQDLTQIRQHLIDLHNKFSTTHQLSYNEVFWLTVLYARITNFDPYNQQDWVDELSRADVVPSAVVLRRISTIQHTTSDFHALLINKNPLDVRYAFVECGFYRTLFVGKKLRGMDVNCPYPTQLRDPMIGSEKSIPLIKYDSFNDAITEYIWIVNTNPAFADFRTLRAERRGKQESIDDWSSQVAYDLTNPDRIFQQKNYQGAP
ncbi:MAG: hypothetical protein K5Q00_03855 [Gammaproteobacteria bacterium]|nr:hypothetical protein [Gammaproteobacteria bacterium]